MSSDTFHGRKKRDRSNLHIYLELPLLILLANWTALSSSSVSRERFGLNVYKAYYYLHVLLSLYNEKAFDNSHLDSFRVDSLPMEGLGINCSNEVEKDVYVGLSLCCDSTHRAF